MKLHILSKSILVNIRTNLINLNYFYDVRKTKMYILNKPISNEYQNETFKIKFFYVDRKIVNLYIWNKGILVNIKTKL